MTPYVEAARPRTLPAALAPVLVGTAAARTPLTDVSWLRFALALLVALALQVAVNYANDYFDGVRGVDTEARVGPRRAVASGLVAPGAMKRAIAAALAVAAVAGLGLAVLVGWELLLVGLAAMLAALGYSGGPRPYASAGLGEVFVFVFFGLVATVGSTYVQDEGFGLVAVLAAIPMGCLATALLVVNNLRDIPTDREAGKVTLAVRLGESGTRRLYVGLVAAALVVLLPLALLTGEGWLALPLLSLPLLWPGVQLVRHAALGPRLIEALERTAKGQLAYAVLFALALAVATGLTESRT
ncbi:1,4-dihydroxy-2-naphthoate polyprenyltransferase [Egicoccus halophilus]|uniref:1,4-dihydroxy-2-naphthoate octaprenyltransferase n=1 Tax=Egicoccus halophilus TaxID=1670830 RepID=A0A8J3A7L6_9ACTN|nr:1,4-dihydroxy-2-naphthoate polyprenyltransferase [Egicoccus halophilus]GGI05701.1 1,4-dihydroxy-2-naphthoate octaprenyltransferase [Egicoccus halophilus]